MVMRGQGLDLVKQWLELLLVLELLLMSEFVWGVQVSVKPPPHLHVKVNLLGEGFMVNR
jgi:hypothetical protein